jgi:hypothetical protein
MSVLDRFLGKTPPPAGAAPAGLRPMPDAPDAPAAPAATEARLQEEESALSTAIAAGDAAAVGRWVLEGSSTRVRQHAAHVIEDPDQLRELIRATRHGKDKTVHRILTDKRDARLAEQRRVEQERAEAEAAGRLEQARIELEQRRHAREAEAARQHAAAVAAEAAERRRQLEAQVAAEAAAAEARAIEARRLAELEAEQLRQAADEAAVHHLLGLLRQARAALEAGGTARAARLRSAIAEKLPQAPALPEWFARQLEQLDTRLEELKDWKTFRVEPKRAQLIERMQSLVGADLSPEELARQIRRLRDEWRTLHRGAGEAPAAEWQQFDATAERAYAPCREHFARQAEQRRENQARREALLERLAAFVARQSAEPADATAIREVLAEARQEWQQHAPVDPAVVKTLQTRFHALLEELQSRLEAEYATHVQARREIIARAAALATVEDTREAIAEAKRLQRTWTGVGPVPRHQDRALWEEFRRHCDAVFERSAQQWAAHDAALEAGEARAGAICAELERIATLAGEPLMTAAKSLDGLRAEFDALELPRASARDLRQRARRANERCTAALSRERDAAGRRAWTDLYAAAAAVRAWGLAAATGVPAADREALEATARAAVAALTGTPKGTRAPLERQLEQIAAGTQSTDLPANEAALRMLCIRAELATDVETPPEDAPLRREYQMQRLVASLGRGERETPADLDTLALAWLAVGPVEPAVHDSLVARFERCRGGAPARS